MDTTALAGLNPFGIFDGGRRGRAGGPGRRAGTPRVADQLRPVRPHRAGRPGQNLDQQRDLVQGPAPAPSECLPRNLSGISSYCALKSYGITPGGFLVLNLL
jgi:hypothetical protein